MASEATSAGELLRQARTSAGLTQVELAQRLGIQQSVISAYESGRRQPSVPTLATMIAATEHQLLLDVRPVERTRKLAGPLGRRIRRRQRRLLDVAARYGATNVRVFGSVARGSEGSDSDIDVLVDLPSTSGLFTLMRLERDLENLLEASVDVVPADSVKPRLRAAIERDLVSLS
jgi:predicted nucleotidyltransferase/DNA-binding XRE family transcriptional regulator